jgi:GTP-binding protein HflX
VLKVLGELKVIEDKPRLLVLNQCDRMDAESRAAMLRLHPDAVLTSALTGEGLDELNERIKVLLARDAEEFEIEIDARSAETGRVLADITRHGKVLSQEWIQESDAAQPKLRAQVLLSQRWREQLGIEGYITSPIRRAPEKIKLAGFEIDGVAADGTNGAADGINGNGITAHHEELVTQA